MFISERFVHQIFGFFSMFMVCVLMIFQSASHAEVTLDGTLGPEKILELIKQDFLIEAKYGTINDTNLFHSFGKFNIDTGQSATFTGPDAIKNIIGRVTGGTLSSIDGLIRADLKFANLYLLNPSGFLFGPNARLDVNGSFHVSTSDYISLGSEGIFYADPIKTSLLTVDPPTAFGFLGSNPAEIIVRGSMLEVPEGKTLSLVGGDIEISGSNSSNRGQLTAPGGRIDIASVSSKGEVIPNYSVNAPDLLMDSFEKFGNIDMDNAYVDARGNGGGTIFIRGGKLTVDSAFIYASATGAGGTAPGAGIDIKVSGDMLFDDSGGTGSAIGTNIIYDVNEDSGGVRIRADNLEIRNGASITSVAFPGSTGQSGDIELNTNSLLVQNTGGIQAGTGGTAKSGDIIINTGSLEIRDAGYIYTNTFGGSGNSGDISVTADNVLFLNEKYPGYFTGITTQTYGPGTGNSGNVTLTTKNLEMLPGTEIGSPTWSLGQGGDIRVTIEEKGSITGIQGLWTGIFSNTFYSGTGGDIEINAGHLELNTEASIQVQALSVGNAGNLSLDVNTLEVKDGSYISTTGLFGYGGASGNMDIVSDNIILSGLETSTDPFGMDSTGISTVSGYYGGDGGYINIQTTNLEMTNRSLIVSTSFGKDDGGAINIKAKNIEILDGSGINANANGTGAGGLVVVEADHILVSGVHPDLYLDHITNKEMLAPSAIASQAGLNGGNGGNQYLKAGTLEVLDGGILSTGTVGTGNAGNINIVSAHLLVSGENADMKEFLINSGTNPKYAASQITASTNHTFLGDLATGNGGDIRINATDLMMTESGSINSETTTPGNGGNIQISAESATLFSKASISAMSEVSELAGNAGNIKISTSKNFSMDNTALITSSEQSTGGDITVQAYNMALANNTLISAQSRGDGNSGNIDLRAEKAFTMDKSSVTTEAEKAAGGGITIQSQDMDLANNTLISAQSSGQGDAGSIYLAGQHSLSMDTSNVTTEARQADGGNIKLYADYMIQLANSEITTSVGGGAGTTGGNISIDPKYVILKKSKIIANAFEGQGGNIEIVSDVFLADPDSIIDASSSLGIDGQVDIRSPITNVTSLVSPLSKDFRSVVALLRKPCMARVHKGEYSSFMIKGRDSLPVQPGRFLSSPLSIR